MPVLVFSSEIYRIAVADVLALENGKDIGVPDTADEVIVLIGTNPMIGDTANKDVLIKGRDIVRKAAEENIPFIPVRLAFIPANKPFDLLSPIIRALRYKIHFYGSHVYHLDPKDIRAMKIERTIKTRENAYSFTNPKYRMPPQERKEEYSRIFNSIKENGFQDDMPIDIMLCRLFGAKDCVNNGHHRMGIALELGLNRVPVRFSAAGAAPKILRPALKFLSTANLAFKRWFGH
ncbi:MAG: hypothetical protein IJ752_07565 [Alphaproteobacteria bacterium]|nr:hypothetical protein [Alphaproteobacteria bacterium]